MDECYTQETNNKLMQNIAVQCHLPHGKIILFGRKCKTSSPTHSKCHGSKKRNIVISMNRSVLISIIITSYVK